MNPKPKPTHYETLGLPSSLQNGSALAGQTLRAAYRAALLRWHPDKSTINSGTLKSSRSEPRSRYSIDQISTAYSTLSDSKKREEYNRELRAQDIFKADTKRNSWEKKFKTGVEIVDLDDLTYDEAQGVWYRGCRCGDEKGFEVREENLEEGQTDGEVAVGCKGCSLWLRVLFGTVHEEADLHALREAAVLDGLGTQGY